MCILHIGGVLTCKESMLLQKYTTQIKATFSYLISYVVHRGFVINMHCPPRGDDKDDATHASHTGLCSEAPQRRMADRGGWRVETPC